MTVGQAAGSVLGTTIKDRQGSLFYFFGILAVGLLPWTFLLGWLWRRAHWRGLDLKSKDGWTLLNADGHFHLCPVFIFTGQIARLHPPDFPGAGGDAGLAVFRQRAAGQIRAGVRVAILPGQFVAVAGDFPAGHGLRLPQPTARMDEMANAGHGGNDSFRRLADAKMETIRLRHACRRTGDIEFGDHGG